MRMPNVGNVSYKGLELVVRFVPPGRIALDNRNASQIRMLV